MSHIELEELESYWIYDIETYCNCFTFVIIRADLKEAHIFEISFRKNNIVELLAFLKRMKHSNSKLVGFNNLGFDYPVLHFIIETGPTVTAYDIFDEAQRLIESNDEDRFRNTIKNPHVKQIDLYKIHHFDNNAKRTSLKILKFNMRTDELQDLPYDIFEPLTSDQIDKLIEYNIDDVLATLKFFNESKEAINLRKNMSIKYDTDFTNFSDSKIGSEIFVLELEKEKKGTCFTYFKKGRKIKQTKRKILDFSNIVLPYVKFERPEFQAILEWIQSQKIESTKGVFKDIPEHRLGNVAKYTNLVIKKSKKMDYIPSDNEIQNFLKQYPLGWVENATPEQKYSKRNGTPLKAPTPKYFFCWKEAPYLSVIINGHEYIFGTGGLHSSVSPQIVTNENEKYKIIDLDVESYYPNLAIMNTIYPEHLSDKFCKIYKQLFEERKKHPKGSAVNLAIKLSLNSTYGNSNNEYSPFYDPYYTMKITLNGQLSLCMLIEQVLKLDGAISVQSNTDGITIKIKSEDLDKLNNMVSEWEKETKLKMESNEYLTMHIRDVNNYVAKYKDSDKVKLKGAYAYELEHHKNQSALVVKKAVAESIIRNIPVEEYIKNHKDMFDFMLRTKVPRSSKLVLNKNDQDIEQQNVSRYFVSNSEDAGELVKVMPPLPTSKEPDKDRRIGIAKGKKVKICNNKLDFDWSVDYDYYVEEALKLLDVFSNINDDEE